MDVNPSTDALVRVTNHDPSRFGDLTLAATAPFNRDEETSGVIDAAFEGGQLLTRRVPLPPAAPVPAMPNPRLALFATLLGAAGILRVRPARLEQR